MCDSHYRPKKSSSLSTTTLKCHLQIVVSCILLVILLSIGCSNKLTIMKSFKVILIIVLLSYSCVPVSHSIH